MRRGGTLVIDCQADLLSDRNTRLVVPLLPPDQAPKAAARRNPVVKLAGGLMVMVTQFAASGPCAQLGEPLASLRDEELTIGNTLDLLISGL